METCCKSSEIYENFKCNSFSYSATSNYCQLMEEQTTNKMQENAFYNFYLREPFVKSGVESDTSCYQKRYEVRTRFLCILEFMNQVALKPLEELRVVKICLSLVLILTSRIKLNAWCLI